MLMDVFLGGGYRMCNKSKRFFFVRLFVHLYICVCMYVLEGDVLFFIDKERLVEGNF